MSIESLQFQQHTTSTNTTSWTYSNNLQICIIVIIAVITWIGFAVFLPNRIRFSDESIEILSRKSVTVAINIPQQRKENSYNVPFLIIHSQDWGLVRKALINYEHDMAMTLKGLSRSLEVCLQMEDSMGLHHSFLSNSLRTKIQMLATLHPHNWDCVMKLLGIEIPTLFMLPDVPTVRIYNKTIEATNTTESFKKHPIQSDPPSFIRRDRLTWTSTTSDNTLSSSSYDSVQLMIAHLVRDWSSEGATIRTSLYDWCRQQINKQKQQLVLVPGAGLGRLAYDVSCDGHYVEANELSLIMTTAAYHLFYTFSKSFTIHPFLSDFFMNEVQSDSRYDAITIFPPSSLSIVRPPKGHLSYTIGDFTTIYAFKDVSMLYDVVITCFFLDTASNVLEYIANISNILRSGGQWINVGPLQWHSNAKIHPAANELQQLIILAGFQITHWSIDTTPIDYRLEESIQSIRSTRFEGYRPLRFVARKCSAKTHSNK
jgi:N2227-like protein